MSIQRSELFNVWCGEKQSNKKEDAILEHIYNKTEVENRESEGFRNSLMRAVSGFLYILRKKWAQANRTKQVFEANNKSWLEGMFIIPKKFR